MRIPEILAPAGNLAAFRAALAGGADAVYCGLGNDFNARRGADNLDEAQLAEACKEAHVAGSRVYLTVNIAIQQDELPRALALVARAGCAGVDGVIVQDWGLFAEVRARYPQLELHVSTQANIHDARAALWLGQQGASRVTLSRELSLPEIALIAQAGVQAGGVGVQPGEDLAAPQGVPAAAGEKDLPAPEEVPEKPVLLASEGPCDPGDAVASGEAASGEATPCGPSLGSANPPALPEVEVFAHGALCFCYSGLCMMSALRGPRSANRGLCAQPCRLPHLLVDAQGRRVGPVAWERGLCPKDAKSTEHLEELVAADVSALKLEGRMKGPEYVLSVVSSYRAALDAVLKREEPAFAVERRLKRAFNRDFTDAYLRGASDNDMMSYERSNNRGELLGVVTRSRGRTAWVRPEAPVGAGDLLELRPQDRPDQFLTTVCPRNVAAGQEVALELKRPMAPGTPVRLLRSQEALDAAAAVVGKEAPRLRPVRLQVRCRLGEPLQVGLTALPTLHGEAVTAWAQGPVVEPARTRELTRDDLAEHAARLGGTPFVAQEVAVELDPGCGLGFSTVHRVRAQAVEALQEAILRPFVDRAATVAKAPVFRELEQGLRERREAAALPAPQKPQGSLGQRSREALVCVLVETPEAARAARDAGAQLVYAPVDALAEAGIDAGAHWGGPVVPLLDEVCRQADQARQDRWVTPGAPCAVGGLSELLQAAAAGAKPQVRGCVPVHNASAVQFLEEAGAAGFWLSPELSLKQLGQVCAASSAPCGLVVWGHTRAMTSEHCVLQMADACVHDCARCGLRRRQLYLENIDGRRLPVRTDVHGRSRIWWSEPLDAVPLLDRVLMAGVRWLGVDATLLNPRETAVQVARLRHALDALSKGEALPEPWPGSNTGHLLRPVR